MSGSFAWASTLDSRMLWHTVYCGTPKYQPCKTTNTLWHADHHGNSNHNTAPYPTMTASKTRTTGTVWHSGPSWHPNHTTAPRPRHENPRPMALRELPFLVGRGRGRGQAFPRGTDKRGADSLCMALCDASFVDWACMRGQGLGTLGAGRRRGRGGGAG